MPGIVSRGHGRADAGVLLLDAATPPDAATPAAFGDEPLLMHRRTGAPVAVGAPAPRGGAATARGASRDRRPRRRRRPAAPRAAARRRAGRVRRPRHRQRLAAARGPAARARERDLAGAAPSPRPVSSSSTAAGPRRPRARCPRRPSAASRRTRALGGAVALADWARGAPATPRGAARAARRAAAGRRRHRRPRALLRDARGRRPGHRAPAAGRPRRRSTPCPGPPAPPTWSSPRRTPSSSPAGRSAGTRVWVATLDFGLPDGAGPRPAPRAARARSARAPT